ncbi:MAG: DUF6851 domain-containing protein [Pseudomonadota bacterium]
MTTTAELLVLNPETQLVSVVNDTPTPSILWDRAVQAAVIETAVGPTIASRAYAITHTAIYDAWASFDIDATGSVVGDTTQVGVEAISDANKAIAMSFAAYTVLIDLFPAQQDIFDAAAAEAGIDPTAIPAEGSPEALGIAVGEAIKADRADDGSNQANGYADTTGYAPTNPDPGTINDITAWTPEFVPIDPDDPEERPGETPQSFLTPHWGEVTPFGIQAGADLRPEAPQAFFTEAFSDATLNVEAGTITLGSDATIGGTFFTAGTEIPVTPDLVGEVIETRFITQAEEVIDFSANLTEEQKLIAEFWEDGGGTSFPPGTWMTFGQFVSTRDGNTLDEDAQLFFQLANAVQDAGIATWETKFFYDYARPVRAIRELGKLGLIGDEGPDGNTIEAYAGEFVGTQTILAEDFITYQTPGADVSPPFAEYTSGHSAFSAAGAAVLASFTGSNDFGGEITFPALSSRFEPSSTPSEDLTLGWSTFTDAADEAGLSRLYGGIHFEDGDLNGRTLGAEAGAAVIAKAEGLIDGSDAEVSDARDIGGRSDDDQVGGRGDDRLFGRSGDDVQSGFGGNDELSGGRGDDRQYGGDGDDTLNGGRGDDLQVGGAGNDTYRGGQGDDTFRYEAGLDTILDFTLSGRRGTDTLDLVTLETTLDEEQDFYDLALLLANDGDETTGVSVDGDDLIIDLSAEDTLTLERVVGFRGLDEDLLTDPVAIG